MHSWWFQQQHCVILVQLVVQVPRCGFAAESAATLHVQSKLAPAATLAVTINRQQVGL
jgi:hypothetical protein